MASSTWSARTAFTAPVIGSLVALAAMVSPAQPAAAGTDTAVTQADRDAARNAVTVQPHALPVHGAEGSQGRKMVLGAHRRAAGSAAEPASSSASSAQLKYPADLTYQGGQVLATTEHHAIYMRPNGACPIAACWGNPEGFLSDLSRSEFVHVSDQYVNSTASNRYPVGRRATVSFEPPFNFSPNAVPFTDADMVAVVHAVASKTGNTGYGHLYHVFLPQGTDECFDNTYTVCYSPDNLSSFAFCAYHGYADFPDIGHVLYTVEPFQNVPGCSGPPNTPNGQLADSTNSVLSHEFFETITDPDLDAWWNNGGNLDLNGYEIGDECQWFATFGTNVYFDPSYFSVGERTYAVQSEYDNARHACSMVP